VGKPNDIDTWYPFSPLLFMGRAGEKVKKGFFSIP
jgi:hypothetical protein